MKTHFRWLALLTFAISLPAFADDYTGSAYELGSGKTKLLYKFKHHEEKSGETTIIQNTFTTPDDKNATVEDAELNKDLVPKRFAIHQLQTGENGLLEVKSEKIYFSWTKDGKTKNETEDLKENLIVGPSTVPYLRKNWSTLMKGEDLNTRFAALDRKETVGFKFFKDKETKVDGKDVVIIKMKPTSFVISALVNPLYFTFEKDGSRVLEISGRILPKIHPKDDAQKWDDVDADVVYRY